MVETSIPWRRDGPNSWNDLVQRVNDVLENPPDNTDCEPIAPLPEVDECHQWTTQDITDMQDALKLACDTNEFTLVIPCDKWKKSIIDEIETAIVTGFCDCNPLDECAPPCDNQGPKEERFLLSEKIGPSCTEDPFLSCPIEATNSFTLSAAYTVAETAFTTSLSELCVLIEEVTKLEEELVVLQDKLNELTELRDIECDIDPESATCLTLTQQVDDKQTEVDDKQTELDNKIIERDDKAAEETTNRSDMIAAAADTVNNALNAVAFGRDLSEIELVVASPGVPWTNFECADPLKIPTCFGPVNECQATWVLRRQTVFITRIAAIGGLGGSCECRPLEPLCAQGQCLSFVRARGTYTVDGSLVVFPFPDCLGRPTILCNCGFNQKACDLLCDNLCSHIIGSVDSTSEWKLFITPPEVRGNEACNTGVPCTLDPP